MFTEYLKIAYEDWSSSIDDGDISADYRFLAFKRCSIVMELYSNTQCHAENGVVKSYIDPPIVEIAEIICR